MCSGIIFPSSRKFIVDNFGNIPDDILCCPKLIKGNRVYETNDSPCMDVPFSIFDNGEGLEEEGFNTWRSDFDFWLCSQTDAFLADECRFDDFYKDGQKYVVTLRHLGKKTFVKTKFLIGADGTISRVRKKAFPEFDKNVGLIPNYEEVYMGEIDLEPGWLYLFMDRSVTGYFATVFHKDNQIVIVTGVNQRESVKEYFERFRTYLQERHGLIIDKMTLSNGIVLTDMSAQKNYCLGMDNILLVGEAGGFLRGGEGITSSLISGKAAGDAVLESNKSGKPAIDHFKELASDEMKTCNKVHENISEAIGFNVFTRA